MVRDGLPFDKRIEGSNPSGSIFLVVGAFYVSKVIIAALKWETFYAVD